MEKESDSDINELTSKAKTKQEIAEEYGICVKTLNSRLKEANIILGPGLIFPKSLKFIYATFGMPKVITNFKKALKKTGGMDFVLLV